MNKKTFFIIAGVVIIISLIIVGIHLVQKPAPEKEEVIKIGAILPLTGAASEFGQYNRETTKLVLEEFERKHGVRLRLYVEDSASSAKEAVNAYRKLTLTDSGIQIVSSELSSVSMSIAPIVTEENRLLVGIAATPKLNEYPYVLRNYPVATLEAEKFAEAVEKLSVSEGNLQIVIFHVNDEFGISTAETTNAKLSTKISRAIIRRETYGSEIEIRSAVLKYKDADVVILIGYGKEMGFTVRELRKYNTQAIVIASPEIAFKDPLSLISFPDPKLYYIDLPDPSEDIVALYNNRLGRNPNLVDLIVWDGLHIALSTALDLLQKQETINGQSLISSIRDKQFSTSVGLVRVDKMGNTLYPLVLRDSSSLEYLKRKLGTD